MANLFDHFHLQFLCNHCNWNFLSLLHSSIPCDQSPWNFLANIVLENFWDPWQFLGLLPWQFICNHFSWHSLAIISLNNFLRPLPLSFSLRLLALGIPCQCPWTFSTLYNWQVLETISKKKLTCDCFPRHFFGTNTLGNPKVSLFFAIPSTHNPLQLPNNLYPWQGLCMDKNSVNYMDRNFHIGTTP